MRNDEASLQPDLENCLPETSKIIRTYLDTEYLSSQYDLESVPNGEPVFSILPVYSDEVLVLVDPKEREKKESKRTEFVLLHMPDSADVNEYIFLMVYPDIRLDKSSEVAFEPIFFSTGANAESVSEHLKSAIEIAVSTSKERGFSWPGIQFHDIQDFFELEIQDHSENQGPYNTCNFRSYKHTTGKSIVEKFEEFLHKAFILSGAKLLEKESSQRVIDDSIQESSRRGTGFTG